MKKGVGKYFLIVAGVVAGLVILVGIIFSLMDEGVLLGPLIDGKLGVDEIKRVSLSSSELQEIKIVKEAAPLFEGHPDYSGLYELLEKKKGDIGKIATICDEFNEFNSIYCLKKASQQNQELREEICRELSRMIVAQYGDRLSGEKLNAFVEGHQEDCLLGIPQFMY
ncbi:hypothetical protein J4462_04190 [Candidatus Pacearchaeota archaeon]|nr:hypothetical protein [Candidatus Pacearchaeota archaeon]